MGKAERGKDVMRSDSLVVADQAAGRQICEIAGDNAGQLPAHPILTEKKLPRAREYLRAIYL
jgi:hypothetical protein